MDAILGSRGTSSKNSVGKGKLKDANMNVLLGWLTTLSRVFSKHLQINFDYSFWKLLHYITYQVQAHSFVFHM